MICGLFLQVKFQVKGKTIEEHGRVIESSIKFIFIDFRAIKRTTGIFVMVLLFILKGKSII